MKKKSLTLCELAELTDSRLVGDPSHLITGIENLDQAAPHHAAFLENSRYEKQMKNSHAGVVFIHPSVPTIEGRFFLLNDHPSLAFQKAIEFFILSSSSGFPDIHPSAVIHETVILEEGVTIGPNAVIDRGTHIGKRTHIGAGACIGADVTIGEECFLHPNAVVRERCLIGNRVTLQSGAVIGSCGFGYYTDPKGIHHTLRQVGIVIIEDDVEIGANTTIDRARFKSTRIGKGTKIDNLVQIAHQVEIGDHNLIVSQVGIAGSTKTGRNVVIGGQVGVVGHITITDHVMIAARAGVSKGIDKSGIYSGAPAIAIKEFNTQIVQLRSIGKLKERIVEIEKKLTELEKAAPI